MATFSYASRDYDTIKSDLLARANRVFPEWVDRDPSDFGMMLLDLWAYNADVLHYYIDRAAGEAFLPSAQQRESVLAVANLFNYIPRGRSSATGTVTLSNTTTSEVVIAPLTALIARHDDKTYHAYIDNGGNIPPNDTSVFPVLEGTVVEDEVVTTAASGQVGQRYALRNANVVDRSVQVWVYEDGVNPTAYQRVSRMTSADTGDRVFVLSVNAENDTELVFGTSVNGFIPPAGSKIVSTYTHSSGKEGNLPAGVVTGFRAAAPTGVGIVSSSTFSGGVDEESITSLKRSIPSAISAQNRAVTRNDFISLALQVNGVAKASLAFVPGAGGATAGNASVTIYPQPERSDFLDPSPDTFQTVPADMQVDVVNSLQPKALLGVDVICAPEVEWTPIDIVATVHVADRYVSNWVLNDVSRGINELFEFDNVFFGQRLTIGQLYRIILNVPGVEFCDITGFDVSDGFSVPALVSSISIDELKLPRKGAVVLNMVGGITTSS